MSDQTGRAELYRKNRVNQEDIIQAINDVQDTKRTARLTGAVVFSFGREFALVTDHKDAMRLLEYGDPVGVVGIGGFNVQPKFVTFKGQRWASKHAKQIIKQAEVVVDAYHY